jgi:hypothetical protein
MEGGSLQEVCKSASWPLTLLHLVAMAAIAVLACGCATDGPRDPVGLPVTDVLAALETGQIRLTCGASCAGYYGGFRKLQKARYDRHQWRALALDVARIGYGIDQSYFYLGRAAEGLGYINAARIYYQLAIAHRSKCGRVFDTCDGLVVPDDARSRLRGLPPQ